MWGAAGGYCTKGEARGDIVPHTSREMVVGMVVVVVVGAGDAAGRISARALCVGGPFYMLRNWYVTAPCSSLQETPCSSLLLAAAILLFPNANRESFVAVTHDGERTYLKSSEKSHLRPRHEARRNARLRARRDRFEAL